MDKNLTEENSTWYCLRTQPRRERIAWANLLELPEVEVLFPRARYQRKGPKGKRWVMEPLFPNYLFAKFDPMLQQRAVKYARGVSYLVKKGDELATVPEQVIADIAEISDEGIFEVTPAPLTVGDRIKVIGGIFTGAEADIVSLVPARERVRILLEILGRETPIDIGFDEIERPDPHPLHR
ncbi:MAG: transcription termination/antitermination protein NusG [Puniceicoccales bacterium]